MSEEAVHNGHGSTNPVEVMNDLLEKGSGQKPLFWRITALLGLLTVAGIVGFAIRLTSDGLGDTPKWGYHMALFALILTAVQGAPMVAIAPRIAKAHWRRSISRAAELFGLVGVVSFLIYIPLIWVLPSMTDGRRTLWFYGELNVPAYMPQIMATLVLVSLVVTGLSLLWVSARPDFAFLRDRSQGRRRKWYGRLAHGWIGSSQQWYWQKHRLGILGAFYFMMLVTVHFNVSVDFGMALVPGWIDALYPVTHAHSSLQSGVAITLVAMYVFYKWGPYKEYINFDQFWGLGKLLFALSLLWFWFWFSSFIIFWYGAKPSEEAILDLLMVGPYLPIFFVVFFLVFFIPLWAMIWNPLRRSVWGPVTIAISVLIATALDRIRVYVGAFSVSQHENKHQLDSIPDAVLPGLPDVLIWIGGIAACVLVYMLAARFIPPINIWEQKELKLYQVHKKFHRTEVQILGKPD